MADSFTPKFNFTLPEVGGSADSWGDKLNANWGAVEDALLGHGFGNDPSNLNYPPNDRVLDITEAGVYAYRPATVGAPPGDNYGALIIMPNGGTGVNGPLWDILAFEGDPAPDVLRVGKAEGNPGSLSIAWSDAFVNQARNINTDSTMQGGGDLTIDRTLGMADTGWQTPTLLNGWAEMDPGTYGSVAYRMLFGNLLVFRGRVDGRNATSAVMFTVPSEYRPVNQTVAMVMTIDADTNALIVDSNGDVRNNSVGQSTDILYLSSARCMLD